jgi:hypothetical protein
MMGRQTGDQSQLFYLFNLEGRVPAGHLLRRINPMVTRVLSDLREKLAPFYSEIGRPSIDPESHDPDAARGVLLWHPLRAAAVRGGRVAPRL